MILDTLRAEGSASCWAISVCNMDGNFLRTTKQAILIAQQKLPKGRNNMTALFMQACLLIITQFLSVMPP